ncbi:MAG: alpha-1,2-fucosyltransferase [Prolixibacteraceae bacterium]|jgi:hypothetical protein|nr:alpha-1,2-fucosyltransferase [Prolixibacteraceae bacterium]
MIITEILGGLGNQLFEYAHARALSIRLDQELYFDLSFFDSYHRNDVYRLDKFNTSVKVANFKDIQRLKQKIIKPDILRRGLKKLGASGYYSKSNHFENNWIDRPDIKLLEKKDSIYISGYFANQKYFIEIENIIRHEITLKEPLNSENEKVLTQIKNSNSVSIHIRRGDYVNNHYFAELPLDYYYRAIDYLESYSPNSTYFIFSDDMPWVKENFKLQAKIIYVDINDSLTDYMELILMASCQHNIIANSTFSWWAGWINNNINKVVIAPNVWFGNSLAQEKYKNGHLVPNSWIKI